MKRAICVFIIVLLLLTIIPTVAFADSYSSGTVTIDTIPGGTLEDSILAALGGVDPPASIFRLIIADGVVYTLTAADIDYIDTELTAMTHLDTGSTVLFNYNGDGTTGDVGSSFLYNNDVIKSVSLDNAIDFGGFALAYCDALTSVNLPAAKTFGDFALAYCTVLELVNLPLAETFGVYAFYYSDALISATLPSAITLGDSAFEGCAALTSVNLLSAQTFGNYVFGGCDSLTILNLLSAKTFGTNAFNNCDILTTINLPSTTQFGANAFSACDGQMTLTLGSTIPSADGGTFGTVPANTNSTVYVPFPAESAYLAVADGNTADDLWWGWTVQGVEVGLDPPENPQTGDTSYAWIYIAALALLLSFAGIVALKKSKRETR